MWILGLKGLRPKNTLLLWVPEAASENSERGGQDTCQVITYKLETITEKGRPRFPWPHSQMAKKQTNFCQGPLSAGFNSY